MRNWLLLVPTILSIGFLAGCSGGAPAESKSDTTKAAPAVGTPETKFKVALLTPGPVSDAGWSAMAYDGLKAIETELSATVNNQEAKGTQIKDAMRTYAQEGYQLIIGHGFEYNEPGVEMAKDFPNTAFVSSSGGKSAANAGAFRFYLEQGFYVAGYLGGKMSKTGKLAMIGGPDVPSIRSTFKGFEAGAKAARADVTVSTVFTGKESDVAAAKQATLAAISGGADFVIHQANAAAQGVFDACKEKGAFAFGANADQNSNSSGAVIASAVIVAKPAFVELAKDVKDGKYKGEIKLVGMDSGAIDFVLNPALKDKIPAALVTELEKLIADIKSGKVVVPKDEF